MVLITTTASQRGAKKQRGPTKEIFKNRLARPNHMTKDRSGRKNQDIRIPRTKRLLPARKRKSKK